MTPDYDFHTTPPDPRTTGLLHALFYLAAVLLLAAAIYTLYLYFTHWSGGEDDHPIWQLILGLVYLVASGLIAYATYTHANGSDGEVPPERYVRIADGRLVYDLDQLSGRQEVDLDRIVKVSRPSVRDLVLDLSDGTQQVLPIYLIDEDGKQEELERALGV
ncbi:hypothetical protein LEM8419_00157 [Neolewinella maritima]|uniref:Poly-beta-1,6-N-acetyl-D-glucosamine biosynthesis protein PgaD n=1 Tax=Neolewinella maritima TaxID=1383882 RepID=A0ABM9AWR7_9BACT|nr:hypothetical protein [Neolewinella maritima]CAH0998842.1 hypothetical protein LEM8419_00157 [Neolewinella maritima]